MHPAAASRLLHASEARFFKGLVEHVQQIVERTYDAIKEGATLLVNDNVDHVIEQRHLNVTLRELVDVVADQTDDQVLKLCGCYIGAAIVFTLLHLRGAIGLQSASSPAR